MGLRVGYIAIFLGQGVGVSWVGNETSGVRTGDSYGLVAIVVARY